MLAPLVVLASLGAAPDGGDDRSLKLEDVAKAPLVVTGMVIRLDHHPPAKLSTIEVHDVLKGSNPGPTLTLLSDEGFRHRLAFLGHEVLLFLEPTGTPERPWRVASGGAGVLPLRYGDDRRAPHLTSDGAWPGMQLPDKLCGRTPKCAVSLAQIAAFLHLAEPRFDATRPADYRLSQMTCVPCDPAPFAAAAFVPGATDCGNGRQTTQCVVDAAAAHRPFIARHTSPPCGDEMTTEILSSDGGSIFQLSIHTVTDGGPSCEVSVTRTQCANIFNPYGIAQCGDPSHRQTLCEEGSSTVTSLGPPQPRDRLDCAPLDEHRATTCRRLSAPHPLPPGAGDLRCTDKGDHLECWQPL